MKHGHVRGTKRHRPAATSWYDAIAEAILAHLDATWPEHNDTPQEVISDLTPSDSMTTAFLMNSMTTAKE